MEWRYFCSISSPMSDEANPSLREQQPRPHRERWKRHTWRAYRGATRWGQRHVPPGLRSVLGVLLLLGGVFGFLPVLGFWMIPLGVGLLALDFPLLQTWLKHWLTRKG